MGKTKIVLAEDDEILSSVIIEELEEAGFEMKHAIDGEEAVEMTRRERPGLLLLASEKAPASYPKSSDSASVSGIAAAFR